MPAEGHGAASASWYGRDVRLTIQGGRRSPDGSWTVLLPPSEALRLIREAAAALEAIGQDPPTAKR